MTSIGSGTQDGKTAVICTEQDDFHFLGISQNDHTAYSQDITFWSSNHISKENTSKVRPRMPPPHVTDTSELPRCWATPENLCFASCNL